MPVKISCCIVCLNEEENIQDCLESVRWCDEIVVVDSFSQDQTVEICRGYAQRVIQRKWKGYVDQKSFAVDQATHDWVLYIDADERVTPGLRDEMIAAVHRWGDSVVGFRIPRLVFYLGQWWRRGGWYPDYCLRFFRKSRAVFAGRDPHEKVVVDGRTKKLRNHLVHLTYRNVSHHIDKINRLTEVGAKQSFLEGERWNAIRAILHPIWRFFKFFVMKGGIFEGRKGFFVAWSAATYVFLKYAKLWELEQNAPDATTSCGEAGSRGENLTHRS